MEGFFILIPCFSHLTNRLLRYNQSQMVKNLKYQISSLSLMAKVVISLLLILVLVYILWLSWRQPPAEAVFWQTVERNLQTNSLVSETEILLPSANLTLMNSQTQLSFKPEVKADFYQTLNLDQPPDQEWLWQYLRNFNQDVYFKHYLQTQPVLEDYLNFVHDSSQIGAYDPQTWYHPADLDLNQTNNLQLYLMTVLASDGFLFANFDAESRQKLLASLRDAYVIDFQKTNSYHNQGRLFYEYQVRLDYPRFGQALIEYADLHISSAAQKYANQLSSERQAQLLTPQDTVYTVVIDVYARRIFEIKYNYSLPFVFSYLQLANYNNFVLLPRHSNVINTLLRLGDLGLVIKTSYNNYDQDLAVEIPKSEIVEHNN